MQARTAILVGTLTWLPGKSPEADFFLWLIHRR